MTEGTQGGNRLDDASLIIGRHNGDKRCFRAERCLKRLDVDGPFAIDGQVSNTESLILCKVLKAIQNGMMFDGRRDQMTPLISKHPRRAKDREIVAFCAATSTPTFAALAGKQAAGPLSGLIKSYPGSAADVVDAGRIAVDFRQKGTMTS